jgi:TRAP-type C4-dicarboxylate transport system substrate-binding protein
MRRIKVISLVLCISILSWLLFVSSASAQIKLSYSIFFPAPHKHSVLAAEWGKEIEKRTNGRVVVTMHYGGTLTPAPQVYDGVIKGLSDVGMSVCGYTRGRFPLTEVVELPLGHKSGWAITKTINDFIAQFKPKEFDDVKMMYMHAHDPGLLHTKKSIEKLEDLKGMKIRAFGAVGKMVTALGGAPVNMAMGETYEALSRGVVEASVAPYEALQAWKWGEVVKFTVEAPAMYYSSAFFIAMNKAKWNSIPPGDQKIIEQVNTEWIEKHGKGWDEIAKAGKDFTLQRGNKIIQLSVDENRKWERTLKPLYDDYVKSMKDKGLPGDKVLQFFLHTLYKYQK